MKGKTRMCDQQCDWGKIDHRKVVQRQCLLALRLSLEPKGGQVHAHLWNENIFKETHINTGNVHLKMVSEGTV